MDPREARLAGASVAVHVVSASASIPAGGALALVHLHCTARASESRQTAALEAIHTI